MIGTLPVSALAPLDYRYALDAALAILDGPPAVARCDQPELAAELAQRLPDVAGPARPRLAQPTTRRAAGALWVEPQAAGWPEALGELAAGLATGEPLVIVASQPLARLLPERRAWTGAALCVLPGGLGRLRQGLAVAGLALAELHGAHSPASIALNSIGRLLGRAGRPDLGDKLEFAARLRYRARGAAARLATVGVLVARKGVPR